MAQQYWLASLPNSGSSNNTFGALKNHLGADNGKVVRVEIPALVVGTLDSLMAISDDLVKINNQIEVVVKKIERQFTDLVGPSTGTNNSEKTIEFLKVGNEQTIENYLLQFQWDFARYRFQGRPLSDLISQVQSMTAKADEELKKLAASYTEKNGAVATVQRKKTINLVTSDLEDFLKPAELAKHEFCNTEFLTTILVVVAESNLQEFRSNYENYASEVASFGGPDWSTQMERVGKNDGRFGPKANRCLSKGSPVVPGSAVKIHTEGDMHMFAVTVLKGHYEAGYYEGDEFVTGKFVNYLDDIKHQFREKKVTVRDFVFDASKAGGLDGQLEQTKWELNQVHSTIVRWCKAHYGEIFSGWVHLKLIRVFVESVLRYGLPVDFTTVIIEPNMRKLSAVQGALNNAVASVRADLKDEGNEDGEPTEDDNLPYVIQKFNAGSSK